MNNNCNANLKYNHNQAGFFRLELLVLLIFILFLTGIGQTLWRHIVSVGDYCYEVVSFVGYNDGYSTCSSIDSTMMNADYKVQRWLGIAGYGDGLSQDDLLQKMNDYYNLSWVGLNAHDLKDYLNPDMLQIKLSEMKQAGANKVQEWEYAITQGQFGSSLFSQGDVTGGIGFMQNAAASGDYGVMSQLQLGSIYGGGLGGVDQDLGMANYYHGQALDSLNNLSLDNSSQAKQVIQSLPQAPEQIIQNLKQILGRN
jgi:hypothetical protein